MNTIYINKLCRFSIFAFIAIAISFNAVAQIPDFAHVTNLHPGDSANISRLVSSGVKIQQKIVVAWFPKDSLSTKQMNSITDTLLRGVEAAEQFIKAPLAWQVHQYGMPYTFYFRRDSFISHASNAGFVSVPFWRIRQSKSPWLHEAIHEMLNSKNGSWNDTTISDKEWAAKMPLWLDEGLADYITLKVSEKINLPVYDVFAGRFNSNADSLCCEHLKDTIANYILSFIGSNGALPELFGNRRMYCAPVFYHCSCSFVKYIGEQYGIEPLLIGVSSFAKEQEIIEKSIGRSLKDIKTEWLSKISRH